MKEKQTVLVVDDEPKILELIKSYLAINGYHALCAPNGREALALFESSQSSRQPVALILLDLMLPDFSGEDLCKKVRQVSQVPIIMITAQVEEESIIHGLSIGADDYITKPFSPRQLMARVEAVLRRGSVAASGDAAGGDGFLCYGDLLLDTATRQVRRGNEELTLTRDEYHILALLMSRQAKIWTRDEILEAIKGDDFDGFDRSVDSHIKRLRSKLGDDSKAPRYIVTVYGMGYRLGKPPSSRG